MDGGGNSEKGLTLQDAPAAGGVTVERRAGWQVKRESADGAAWIRPYTSGSHTEPYRVFQRQN